MTTQPTQPDLIPWDSFLAMTPAEIEAAFGSDAATVTVEITKDVRQLMTEEIREEKAS